MKTLLSLIVLALLLAACVQKPILKDGAGVKAGQGCWRFGVAETGNTGPMTHAAIESIPVVKLNYPDLLKACGIKPVSVTWKNRQYVQVRACFKPRPVDGNPGTDTIYLWRFYAGKMEYYQEACHALLGRKHNACNGSYGIGKDESACKWVQWSAENAAQQRRLPRPRKIR